MRILKSHISRRDILLIGNFKEISTEGISAVLFLLNHQCFTNDEKSGLRPK